MMNSQVPVVAILCVSVFTMVGAWNWHFKNLRGLDKGPDLYYRISDTNNSAIVRYVHHQCGSYLRDFRMIPADMQAARCPDARDAKCRYVQDKWRCSVKINPTKATTPGPDLLEVVALRWCLEDIKDWETLIKQDPEEEEEEEEEREGETQGPEAGTTKPGGVTEIAGGETAQPGEVTKIPSGTTRKAAGMTAKHKGKRKKPMGNTAKPKE